MAHNKHSIEKFKSLNKKLKKQEVEFISEDPFDIFYSEQENIINVNNRIKTSCIKDKQDLFINESISLNNTSFNSIINIDNTTPLNITYLQDEEDLLNSLKMDTPVIEEHIQLPYLVHRLNIYTTNKLNMENIPMYKFPFNMLCEYEKGRLFNKIYILFLDTLTNLMKNPKIEFTMFYRKEILIYDKSIMKVSKGLRNILNNNEIEYLKIEDEIEFLCLNHINMCLLMDFILNEIPSAGYFVPFIISKDKFINGMYYEIQLRKDTKGVKEKDKVMYQYVLDGPFCTKDFLEYCKYKWEVVE